MTKQTDRMLCFNTINFNSKYLDHFSNTQIFSYDKYQIHCNHSHFFVRLSTQ